MADSSQIPSTHSIGVCYDTGVTNGDVDWLFRGKSKKLTKKMNSSSLEKDRKLSIVSGSHQQPSSTTKEKIEDSSKVNSKGSVVKTPNGSTDNNSEGNNEENKEGDKELKPVIKHSIAKSSPSGSSTHVLPNKSAPSPTSSIPLSSSPNIQEKSSMFDKFKFGRSRSSSASSVNYTSSQESLIQSAPPASQQSQQPQKRMGSLNFMAGGSTSNSNTESDGSPGTPKSNPSNGKTRSLLSSLSSKFKSGGVSTSPSVSNINTPPSSANISPVASFQPAKLNPSSIGSAFNHGIDNQDLAALVNRLPAGGGIPINPKRKSSISSSKMSSSPIDGSWEKEKGKFFKRKPSVSPLDKVPKESDRVILNKNPNKEKIPLKELNGIKLRRVTFAIDKLTYDPQQQIPSRRPKKGNVLIPEDIVAPPPRLSQGIALNDGTGNKTVTASEYAYSEKELSLALEAQRRARLEAEKHAQEAHLSAKKIAYEVTQYKLKMNNSKQPSEEDEDDNEVLDHDVENIEIDKPLHIHENHFEDPEDDKVEAENPNDLSLETIYTRCCHLREILPIPATLKQLKNKTKPLQVLKLLNPKPTLIDVLSFSDFIAITPINTVIFDNVTMTTEMLKHFLASLAYNKSLEKLSLRNVPIDKVGWKYLCKFLSRNQTLKKLDISQQRIKSDTKITSIRSSMNWDLFIRSLILRGGIEELVINGCKLSDETFKDLIENAVQLSTFRLGIASIELNTFKAKVVTDWIIDPNSKCVGVDIAFNDLTKGQLKYFTNAFNKGNSKIIFFSLNSTHLTDIDEVSELIKSLTNVKSLRFLDLSSLPDLFPGIISKLNKYLPQFPSLKRIHFDLNELSNQSILAIADILPKMNGLFHVSFLGNRKLSQSSAAALYTAVKLSGSIFTLDLDYDLVPDDLSQRIAFYLMRNMDKTMNKEISTNGSNNNDDDNEEELMFDGSLLMETAEKLLIENDKHKDKKEELKIQKIITNALIERTRAVRKDIHRTIDTLFEKRNQGTLSLEGKENLLRFCLLDSSLEKVVHMFEEHAKINGFSLAPSNQISPSTSLSIANDQIVSTPSIEGTLKLSNKDNLPKIELPKLYDNLHDNLHESSTELITAGPIVSPRNFDTFNQGQVYFQGIEQTFQPHQVVIDSSSDGKNVPIDNLTGRPVLMRSVSQTSVHAKEQEKEEGEFHRLGFFIQQRNNNGSDSAKAGEIKEDDVKSTREMPHLNVLPSGSELRDAIIAAKGIESVTDLIDKINNNRVSIEKIYNIAERPASTSSTTVENLQSDVHQCQSHKSNKESVMSKCINRKTSLTAMVNNEDNNDSESIDSMQDQQEEVNCKNCQCNNAEVDAVVDEVYDKLLNDAQRVRSYKQE